MGFCLPTYTTYTTASQCIHQLTIVHHRFHKCWKVHHCGHFDHHLVTVSKSSPTPTPQPVDMLMCEEGERYCKVCGDKAVYVNYGALTCDSCKTFFRRQNLHPKVSLLCNCINCVTILLALVTRLFNALHLSRL